MLCDVLAQESCDKQAQKPSSLGRVMSVQAPGSQAVSAACLSCYSTSGWLVAKVQKSSESF